MKILPVKRSLSAALSPLSIVPVYSNRPATKVWKNRFEEDSWKLLTEIDRQFSGQLINGLKKKNFTAKAGSSCRINLAKESKAFEIVVRSLGEANSSLEPFRVLGGAAAKLGEDLSILTQAIPTRDLLEAIKAISEGALIASYQFSLYQKPKEKDDKTLNLVLKNEVSSQINSALKQAKAINLGTQLARDLVNTPAADMTPKDLLGAAKKIAETSNSQMTLKSFGRAALKKMKAEALLSVTAGSATEPYLIHLDYKPKGKAKEVIALVGKGVTFDSGGLSIKSGRGMMTMKCDMGGAAAVLGIMKAIAALPATAKPKSRIHAIIPSCENMINENATHPGDVVRAIGGKSIEILNTDAEGRLILADALGYSRKLKADKTIDFATLTGACVVALGESYAGLFGDNQDLIQGLKQSGEETGEHLWPLPLAQEYNSFLKSHIADIKNIGSPGPGAITAALFLKHFVPKETAWAHIDLAGPAFISSPRTYFQKGATGFPVRALVRYLTTGD